MNNRRYFVKEHTETASWFTGGSATFYVPILAKEGPDGRTTYHEAVSDTEMDSIYGFDRAEDAFAACRRCQERDRRLDEEAWLESEARWPEQPRSAHQGEDFHADG